MHLLERINMNVRVVLIIQMKFNQQARHCLRLTKISQPISTTLLAHEFGTPNHATLHHKRMISCRLTLHWLISTNNKHLMYSFVPIASLQDRYAAAYWFIPDLSKFGQYQFKYLRKTRNKGFRCQIFNFYWLPDIKMIASSS
jgi:hypothetical protein